VRRVVRFGWSGQVSGPVCCARCALFRGVVILSASFMHTAICISSSYCDTVTFCYLCYFSFCPRHVHVRSSRQHPLHPHPTAAAAPDAMLSYRALTLSLAHTPSPTAPTRRSAAPSANTAPHAITQNVHCLVIWRVTVKYSARGVGERGGICKTILPKRLRSATIQELPEQQLGQPSTSKSIGKSTRLETGEAVDFALFWRLGQC